MGEGFEQGEARLRAKKLGGIAVSARKGKLNNWVTGGWPKKGDRWIVVSYLDGKTVLDDGSSEESEHQDQ